MSENKTRSFLSRAKSRQVEDAIKAQSTSPEGFNAWGDGTQYAEYLERKLGFPVSRVNVYSCAKTVGVEFPWTTKSTFVSSLFQQIKDLQTRVAIIEKGLDIRK